MLNYEKYEKRGKTHCFLKGEKSFCKIKNTTIDNNFHSTMKKRKNEYKMGKFKKKVIIMMKNLFQRN